MNYSILKNFNLKIINQLLTKFLLKIKMKINNIAIRDSNDKILLHKIK